MKRGIDVSFYDGGGLPYKVIDWEEYAKTWDFVFIKCSQANFIDPLFRQQWQAARGWVLRSAYHFFIPYVDPKESAENTVRFLDGDYGELPLLFDLEMTAGRSDTLDRAKSWLSWYEQFTGIRPIIYSSPNFLNNIVRAYQHPWLANYHLHLAMYPWDNLSDGDRAPIIKDIVDGIIQPDFPPPPVPFKKVWFWQWTSRGAPEDVPGYYLGYGHKLAVDFNSFNGTQEEFDSFLTGNQPPTGEPMPYLELKPNVSGEYRSIRAQTSYPTAPHVGGSKIGQINVGNSAKANTDDVYSYVGDVVIGGVLLAKMGDIWRKVYESNGVPIIGWVAEVHLGRTYLTVRVVDEGAPPPEPDEKPLTITQTFDMEGYQSQTVVTILTPLP